MERKRIYLVGLGPGGREQMTQQAYAALADADVLCGYTGYVDLVRGWFPEKETYTTPMTQELARCRWGAGNRAGGQNCGYAVQRGCWCIWHGWPSASADRGRGRGGDHRGGLGITAALSGAAMLGAPLMHDFCVISLSDLLTPWDQIAKRAGVRGRGGQRYRFVQPRLQERERASAAGL